MFALLLALVCLAGAADASGIEVDPGLSPSAAIAERHPVYNWTVAMRDVHLYVVCWTCVFSPDR